MNILVVDDERKMALSLKDNLEFEGYDVDCAHSGAQALDRLKADHYNLLVLDVMMPGMNGFDVLAEIRKSGNQVPVIFLTARAADADKIKGFGLGVDDYVVKPFGLLEFLARVKSVLRRTTPGSELHKLHIGETVVVDFHRSTVHNRDALHELGRYEAGILRLLASTPGIAYTRDQILEEVWGEHAFPSNRTVDNYVCRLRSKIEENPSTPKHITSLYGAGYKLVL